MLHRDALPLEVGEERRWARGQTWWGTRAKNAQRCDWPSAKWVQDLLGTRLPGAFRYAKMLGIPWALLF